MERVSHHHQAVRELQLLQPSVCLAEDSWITSNCVLSLSDLSYHSTAAKDPTDKGLTSSPTATAVSLTSGSAWVWAGSLVMK